MKKVRFYLDKDEEQVWIQEMANKGWALKSFCLGVYTFEPCEAGEYIYQIDLLDNWNGDKRNFADFMSEMDVEVVSQWYRWVFLRKRAENGPFEMYTDIESKVEQYKRIKGFLTAGLVIELICFLQELNVAIKLREFEIWAATALIGMLVLGLLRVVWKCQWKIKQLKQEG